MSTRLYPSWPMLDWEVLSIMDRIKTVSRIPVRPQPELAQPFDHVESNMATHTWWADPSRTQALCERHFPYGWRGSLVWVREPYSIEACEQPPWREPPHQDGRPMLSGEDPEGFRWWAQPHYRASDLKLRGKIGHSPEGGRWSHAASMPRWASRLTLRLYQVTAQRLHDMNESECVAEGVLATPDAVSKSMLGVAGLQQMRQHWDRIHGKTKGMAWNDNPWVWRVKFALLDIQPHEALRAKH